MAQVHCSFIDELWAEAGIERAYSGAMRAAMAPGLMRQEDSLSSSSGLPIATLPGLCCEAVGGARQQAEKVSAAWSLLYRAAHLLDDVEDGTLGAGPGSFRTAGSAINIATGLFISAGLALNKLDNLQGGTGLRDDFYGHVLKMCAGQHADLTVPEPTLEQCWQKAEVKSGLFFALACRCGARLASDDSVRIDRLGEYGLQLGVLIQLWNDRRGLWPGATTRSDLATAQSWSLPVAYAMGVIPDPERSCLRQRLQAAPTDPRAEEEARLTIIQSGAVLYLVVEAARRRGLAEMALQAAAPPSAARDELLALLQQVASPAPMSAIPTTDAIFQPAALE